MDYLKFLRSEDLETLTGYQQPKRQVQWLRQRGIPHFVAKDGSARVLLSVIEGSSASIRKRQSPRLEGLNQRRGGGADS